SVGCISSHVPAGPGGRSRGLAAALPGAPDPPGAGAGNHRSGRDGRPPGLRAAALAAPPVAARHLSVSPAAAVACEPLLETLRRGSSAWDGLLDRSPAASPFASWAWHWA